jgi:hypothetical protein
MKPAERIPLFKKLAAALSDEEMPAAEMDLVLRQHGFSDEDVWGYDSRGIYLGPNRYERALHHLENSGDDEKLLELERYLDPADGGSTVPASVGPGPWKKDDHFRLFISHTHPNARFASEMKTHLGRYRIESFVAHNDIEPSEKWIRVIESALLTCHAAGALLTPDFRKSQWCDQEVGFCLARSLLVVPLIRDADPHGFLSEVQGVKLTGADSKAAAARIFSVLARQPKTADRMAPSVVRLYASAKNADGARAAFTLLGHIPKDAWTPDLVREAVRAGRENSEVGSANLRSGTAVPEATKKLLLPIEKRLGIDGDIPA